jgi:hypothetical protein
MARLIPLAAATEMVATLAGQGLAEQVTEYVTYSQIRPGDIVKLPADDAHGLRVWRDRRQAALDPAPFRVVTAAARVSSHGPSYVELTADGIVFGKPANAKALRLSPTTGEAAPKEEAAE